VSFVMRTSLVVGACAVVAFLTADAAIPRTSGIISRSDVGTGVTVRIRIGVCESAAQLVNLASHQLALTVSESRSAAHH